MISGDLCKYPCMDEFGARITTALALAKLDRKALATHLGVSVQAVGQAIRGGRFSAENTARAARFLGVNWFWLATGEESAEVEDGPPGAEPTYSKRANDMATVFDDLKNWITPAERQAIYSDVMSTMQIAKAGQKAGRVAPADDELSPSSPKSRQPAPIPILEPQRDR